MNKRGCWNALCGLALLATVSVIPAIAQAQTPEYRLVLLHERIPGAVFGSQANRVSQNVVGGTVVLDPKKRFDTHALLWNLSDNSVRYLPSGRAGELKTTSVGAISENAIAGTGRRASDLSLVPLLWERQAGSFTVLPGTPEAQVTGMLGNLIVGQATFVFPQFNPTTFSPGTLWRTLFSGDPHWGPDDRHYQSVAVVWNRTGNQMENLHDWLPAGYEASAAFDISGNRVIGHIISHGKGKIATGCHAVVWDLASRKWTDLHTALPTDLKDSTAQSIWGDLVVGAARKKSGDPVGLVWNLKTGEATNLGTRLGKGYLFAVPEAIAGSVVVGRAMPDDEKPAPFNAFLWDLSTDTTRDLHREYLATAGFQSSQAYAIGSDGVIVGWGQRNGHDEAWALIPTVPQPSLSNPLPTANVGQVSRWLWLFAGLALVVPSTMVILRLFGRRKNRVRRDPASPPDALPS